MTRRTRKFGRFFWKKGDMSITRAVVFLTDQQKIGAEKTLSAAEGEIMAALDKASGR
jgi:hypothetical protein